MIIFRVKMIYLSFLATLIFNINVIDAQCDTLQLDTLGYPEIKEIPFLNILSDSEGTVRLETDSKVCGLVNVSLNGEATQYKFINGKAPLGLSPNEKGNLQFIQYNDDKNFELYHISAKSKTVRIKNIPLWFSLIPPLLAILLALIFKEVIIALFFGIWSGAFIAGGMRIDSIYYLMISFFESLQKYIVGALNNSGHLSVIVFSLLIGGMVALISKNGGMAGVVVKLSKYARSKRSTEFITWLLGVAIFFDDYANTLIVGNTMRSVTDKFKVSREKLAYIVDSTAAPVSAVAFITTWIGAELGYIDDGMSKILMDTNMTAYAVFMSSLKYSFYPILTLIFILFIIYTKKDYGPMFIAEKRAFETGQVSPASTSKEDEPNMEDLSPIAGISLKWYNAVIPVLVVIAMTIFGLVDTGMTSLYGQLSAIDGLNVNSSWSSVWSNISALPNGGGSLISRLGTLIGSSDSYVALLWASISGVTMALVLTVSQRIMGLFDSIHWMVSGFKTMMPALIILTLAWALASCTDELHTADFLSSALQNSVSPYVIPMIIFVLAAVIAFSTGSSWSTMAILYPIAIPTTYAICQANGLDAQISFEILLNVIATVLAASVLGDHCSPISDTTILSSLASDCNHIDHVKTQMPYAMTVGFVSLICCGATTFFGGGWTVSIIVLIVAIAALWFIANFFGKTQTVNT